MNRAQETEGYKLGPFRLESDLDLPELRRIRQAYGRAVTVRLGGVPERIDAAVTLDDGSCSFSASEWRLDVPGVARYFVANGCEVRVSPEPGASPEDVRIYLLGSCFGVLCYQNGLVPLHASAVEHDGKVTAFLADSGVGKSTLVASLARRGYPVVSDDICLLERVAGGGWRVHPVAGWLKLWRVSLEQLGEQPREEDRVFSTQEKYRIYLGKEPGRELALNRLVFPERPASPECGPALEPIGNAEALGRLMGLVYLPYYLEKLEGVAALFRLGAEVLAAVPAYRLSAPLGWEWMEGVLDLLEDRLHREDVTADMGAAMARR